MSCQVPNIASLGTCDQLMISAWQGREQRKKSLRQVVPSDLEGGSGGMNVDVEETVRDSFRMEDIVGFGLPGQGLRRASSRAAVQAAAPSASGRLSTCSFLTTKVKLLSCCMSYSRTLYVLSRKLLLCRHHYAALQDLDRLVWS